MKLKKTIHEILTFTAAFIFLSTISFGQTSAINKNQTNAEPKTIKTKIDIGGYALYVNIAGAGSPTVIFESGSGAYSNHWNLVQPEISKITRTFSYDRAGLGKSDKRTLTKTSCLNQVQELHTLLKNTHVKGPYILVANSYGAFLVKLFANTYPKEVAGVVFVDGTDEKYSEFLAKNLTPAQLDVFKRYPDPDGTFDEHLLGAQQIKVAGKLDALRKKPVIVLTADINVTLKQYANTPMVIAFPHWMEWQQDLVALSDKGKQYVIKGSGHVIQQNKPQVVINAIKKMLTYDLKNRPIPSCKTIELSPEKLKRFVGKYLFAVNDVLTIKEENGHLFADIPYLIQTEMCPLSENEITTKDNDVAATVLKLTESGIAIKSKYSPGEKNIIKVADDYHTLNECWASGKIAEAISKCNEVKKADPENAAISENRLNDLGYDLLGRGKIEEAISVLKFNTELYPDSWNAFDSLGEAYAKTGNKKLAIESYEKSLQLNPASKSGTDALKQLREEK